jgi:iron complex outermembrane recepter protein
VVRNVQAHAKGGELEFAWLPFRGANVQLGVSHLETLAWQVPLPVGPLTSAEMPQAPKWSANALASYDWWLPFGKLSVEADTKWNSQQYLELLNAPADHVGGYAVSNAHVSYSTTDGHWEVIGWVRNLADKWYPVYGVDLSAVGFEQRVDGPPRTYGATVTFRWGP